MTALSPDFDCRSYAVCLCAPERREVLSGEAIAEEDLQIGSMRVHLAAWNIKLLTRLAPNGARERRKTRDPKSLLLLNTNVRSAEKTDFEPSGSLKSRTRTLTYLHQEGIAILRLRLSPFRNWNSCQRHSIVSPYALNSGKIWTDLCAPVRICHGVVYKALTSSEGKDANRTNSMTEYVTEIHLFAKNKSGAPVHLEVQKTRHFSIDRDEGIVEEKSCDEKRGQLGRSLRGLQHGQNEREVVPEAATAQ